MAAVYQAEGNHRLTTSITQEAYQVLTDNATSRTIGKFLSELLVAYGQKRTLMQRVTQLEEDVQQLQIRQSRSTAASRAKAKLILAKMKAGDYVTEEEYEAGLQAQGLVA